MMLSFYLNYEMISLLGIPQTGSMMWLLLLFMFMILEMITMIKIYFM